MTNDETTMLKAALKTDLASFIGKVFATINPGTDYEHNWHIDLMADYLTAAEKGEINRLIINLPPRSLKSICVTVAWPAWILGHDPTKRIIVASFAKSLSVKHSLDCKAVMLSDWYRELFPDTILSHKHNLKAKYLTTKHGFRMATSVGAMITGEGGDVLIIDDPHNPSHIRSTKWRNRVIEWFEQTFSTRLDNKKKGSIVLVMQRLHAEDLTGHLLREPDLWHILKIPIYASEPTKYEIMGRTYERNESEMLHSKRWSSDMMATIMQEMGSNNFVAQYMQEPIMEETAILNIGDISFYDELDELDYVAQSWDTAIKTSEESDYSVCTTWGIVDDSYYLIHVRRGKLSYPELKSNVIRLSNRLKPKFILIEDHASGQSIIQDLRSEGLPHLIAVKQKIDKITRFARATACFQSAVVKLPHSAPWLTEVISELTTFPHAKHDDIVDSISQFLCYMKNKVQKTANVRVREV